MHSVFNDNKNGNRDATVTGTFQNHFYKCQHIFNIFFVFG